MYGHFRANREGSRPKLCALVHAISVRWRTYQQGDSGILRVVCTQAVEPGTHTRVAGITVSFGSRESPWAVA